MAKKSTKKARRTVVAPTDARVPDKKTATHVEDPSPYAQEGLGAPRGQ